MDSIVLARRNELETSSLIKEAYDKAGRHRWIEAAESCRQALSAKDSITQPFTLATLTDFSAECHFKGAFQAKNRQEFDELITLSRAACEKAKIIYDSTRQIARSQRAKSGILKTEFWLQRNSTQRALLAGKIVNLCLESARAFGVSRELKEALKTRLELLRFFREFINLSTDFGSLKGTYDRAVSIGSAMLDALKEQRIDDAKIEALGLMIWFLAVEAQVVMTPLEFQTLADRTRHLQTELTELSRDVKTALAASTAMESAGHIAFDLDGDPSTALNEYKRGLEIATTLGNSLAIGRLHWLCAQAACWLGYSENDPEKKRGLFREGETHALNSITSLEISFQTTELSAAHTVQSQCLIELANLAGSDLQAKKSFLKKPSRLPPEALSMNRQRGPGVKRRTIYRRLSTCYQNSRHRSGDVTSSEKPSLPEKKQHK